MIIGVKSGTFRILHAGHVWMFEECKKQCDYLIVLTNDDHYLKHHKGAVITPLHERLEILRSIKFIDEVSWFQGFTEEIWIKEFREQRLYQEFGKDAELVVFHSAELRGSKYIPALYDADRIIYIDRIDGSTTDIIKTIKELP